VRAQQDSAAAQVDELVPGRPKDAGGRPHDGDRTALDGNVRSDSDSARSWMRRTSRSHHVIAA